VSSASSNPVWSGRRAASPSPSPLRTVLETYTSYGSSRPLPSVLPEALSRMGRCVALGSVCRPCAGSHLTCPFGLHNPPGSCRVVHPAHVSGLSAQAMRPYPPGYVFPSPFGRRRSLLGPSCARWGTRPSLRSAYWRRLTASPDPNGVATFHTDEIQLGWTPFLLRGLGVRTRR
jgi:hypothetical protein